MRNQRCLKWMGLFLLCSWLPAQAVMIGEGTRELTADGEYQFSSEVGRALSLNLSLGLFVMDGLQVGLLGGVSDSDLVTMWKGGAFAEYNVDLGHSMIPFVGVQVLYSYADLETSSEDSAVLGGYAGLKYFIAENIAVSLKYLLEWADDDIFYDDREAKDTNHSVQLGMRFYF